MSRALAFPALVQGFLQQYLQGERGLRRNTVLSYRDAIRLLIEFLSTTLHCEPDRLEIEQIDAQRIRGFLDWLEAERNSSPRTRNQRLAAIKAFFRYVASRLPDHLDRCRLIRDVSNKRIDHRPPEYLEHEHVESLLGSIDFSTAQGLRDLALLTLMVNTGARVQEIVDLDVCDVMRSTFSTVRLKGKGGKERTCPLWSQTSTLLARWLESRGDSTHDPDPGAALFTNARGCRLTRWGVSYILRKHVRLSRLAPSTARPDHITPHTLRHTAAMELLRAKVDITVISAWLGHAHLSITHGYVEIDLRMKADALKNTTPAVLPPSLPAKYPKPSLAEWLDSVGREPDYVNLRASPAARSRARETSRRAAST